MKFFQGRDLKFLEQVFHAHTDAVQRSIPQENLYYALSDLGLKLNDEEIEALFKSVDLDENGWLDFEEFVLATRTKTKVELWLDHIPLSRILSFCISYEDCEDPLRAVTKLKASEICAAVDVFSEGVKNLVMEYQSELKACYDDMDKKSSSVSSGISSKFQTFKMSCGQVDDFYCGLMGRVGESAIYFQDSLHVSRMHSVVLDCELRCQGPPTRTYAREWKTSTAPWQAATLSSKHTASERPRAVNLRSLWVVVLVP